MSGKKDKHPHQNKYAKGRNSNASDEGTSTNPSPQYRGYNVSLFAEATLRNPNSRESEVQNALRAITGVEQNPKEAMRCISELLDIQNYHQNSDRYQTYVVKAINAVFELTANHIQRKDLDRADKLVIINSAMGLLKKNAEPIKASLGDISRESGRINSPTRAYSELIDLLDQRSHEQLELGKIFEKYRQCKETDLFSYSRGWREEPLGGSNDSAKLNIALRRLGISNENSGTLTSREFGKRLEMQRRG